MSNCLKSWNGTKAAICSQYCSHTETLWQMTTKEMWAALIENTYEDVSKKADLGSSQQQTMGISWNRVSSDWIWGKHCGDSETEEQVTHRGCAVPVLGDFQDMTRQSPEQPGVISELTLLWAAAAWTVPRPCGNGTHFTAAARLGPWRVLFPVGEWGRTRNYSATLQWS